jgi:hypothetical protein
MSKQKFFYGKKHDSFYSCEELKECVDELDDIEDDEDYIVIVEMKVSNKETRYCGVDIDYWEPECGINNCSHYTPRNGKNGICKHLTYGLTETGASWKLYRNEHFEKISSRYKK